MTDDYKKNLLNYMIGKMPNENGTEEEIFQIINEIPTSEWPRDGNILPTGWSDFKYEGLIQVQNSELLLLYGGYKTYQTDEVRGIITILNKNFKPLKSIYQYDTGTYLRYIQCMQQAEDNTFYAVDCPDFPNDRNWSFITSQKRFLMFNDFTQTINNDFVLTLQKSYIFPTDYLNFYCKNMYKDNESSNYVFTGNYLKDQNSPDFDGIRIINLKVNVGTENEWNKWDDDGQGWFYGASYVEFQEDNFFCEVLLTRNSFSNRNISLWSKDFSQASFSLKTIGTVNYYAVNDTDDYKNQTVFLNKNEVYFVLNNQRWGITGQIETKYIGLYYYNDITKEFKTIYEKYLGDYDFCNLEAIYIAKNNNDVYIEYNQVWGNKENFASYYFQRLVNNEWNPKLISSASFIYNRRALFVTNEFNLLNYVSYMLDPQSQYWYIPNIKEIYNEANYNGESFIDKNSLNSHSAILYSNQSPVFARNLYNKTQNGSTTTSTVEIPNNYLNEIMIDQKELLSENNNVIVSDLNGFTKNIYETVYLNFVNTISIIDRNNATQVLNQEASTYLNSSINTDNSYDNAKFYNKAIMHYQDSSTREISYEFQNKEDKSVEIVFGLFVDKLIDRVEIVSNDKSTIYQSINLTSLEENKFYTINQKLKII